MIDFATLELSADDNALIGKIVQRCIDSMKANGLSNEAFRAHAADFTMHCMDIAAVHCLCCPLNLLQWLLSAPMEFAQDYVGIVGNIDRLTGQLTNGFWPRHARGARIFGKGLMHPVEKANGSTASHD